MTTAAPDSLKQLGLLVVAVLIPLVLASVLILLEHWDIIDVSKVLNRLPWQLNVVLLVLPGLVPISRLRLPIEWRVATGLAYFLAMFLVMPVYALVVGCTFTGDCL